MANNEKTKMNGEVSEETIGVGEPQLPLELYIDNNKSLNNGRMFDANFNKKWLSYWNKQKEISNYDDIWDKGLPYSFKDLKNLSNSNYNLTDITNAIYNTDFADITFYRAIVMSEKRTVIYKPVNGYWEEQKATEEIRHFIERFMIIMKKMIIDQLTVQVDKLSKNKDEKKEALERMTERHKFFIKLYNFIGGTQQESIIKRLIHKIVMATKHTDFKLENFDRATGYLAFTDGVYSFAEQGLIPNNKAYELMITKVVPYPYQDVLDVSEETYKGCMKFLEQVIPKQEIRKWLLRRYNKASQGIMEKIILILHGEKGNNGKTKLIDLLNETFGEELYCKCNKKLLNADSINSSGGTNEELMSLSGALFAAFSEPSKHRLFDMSVLKELSGGDAITGRRLFKSKEKFRAKCLIQIACNSIPSLDDVDEASFLRIRCVPFIAEFTTDNTKVKPSNYVFKADENIGDYFAEWKYAFMKIILESLEDTPEPIEVQQHTQKFQERESVVMRFVSETVERVEDDGKANKNNYVLKTELWQNFKIWLKEEGEQIKLKKGEFYEDLMKYMIDYRGDTDIKGKRVKGCFFGYKIVDDGCLLSRDDYDP